MKAFVLCFEGGVEVSKGWAARKKANCTVSSNGSLVFFLESPWQFAGDTRTPKELVRRLAGGDGEWQRQNDQKGVKNSQRSRKTVASRGPCRRDVALLQRGNEAAHINK